VHRRSPSRADCKDYRYLQCTGSQYRGPPTASAARSNPKHTKKAVSPTLRIPRQVTVGRLPHRRMPIGGLAVRYADNEIRKRRSGAVRNER
jgi:hypothetical protein